MSDCSLRSRGSRFDAAAFLSHSQTKSIVCSFVRPGQRRAILGALDPPPFLAPPIALVDQAERPDRLALLDELGHAGVDLAAGEVVDGQARHDLVCAARNRARE